MDSHEDRLEADVAQALAQAVDQVDPPAALRARVLQSAGGATTRTGSAKASTGSAKASAGRPLAAWLATAASLAIAAGLGIYASQLRSRVNKLEGELRDAILRADASNTQLAEIRRTAAEAQGSVAVLTAPDLSRVDLAGQTIAPAASARAFWSRSRGLVFTASNLPALPAGRTYQLWVVAGQGPISAGLLKPDANGRVDVLISTPLNPAAPAAMAVTIEPEGGVPAPTGEKYLVGLIGKQA